MLPTIDRQDWNSKIHGENVFVGVLFFLIRYRRGRVLKLIKLVAALACTCKLTSTQARFCTLIIESSASAMHNLSPDQEFIHFAFIKHTSKILIVLFNICSVQQQAENLGRDHLYDAISCIYSQCYVRLALKALITYSICCVQIPKINTAS